MRRAGTLTLLAALSAAAVVTGCRERRNVGSGPYADRVARAVEAIEEGVGVPFKTPPKLELRSREQVREFLTRKFDETTPAEQLAGEEAAYKVMGLLPDTMDLRRFLLDVLAEQVVGYYDPETKVLYVVQGFPDEIVGLTIPHELVHALQDQYVNLDSIQRDTRDSDRQAAAHAVIEGQATYESTLIIAGGSANVAARLPGGWEQIRQQIREGASAHPIFTSAPMVIQETLLFPYLAGAEFVRRFKERHPDSLPFGRLPVSTEQVLHEEAFFGTEPDAPAAITLPSVSGAIHTSLLGEFGTRLFVYQHLRDHNGAIRAATGWDGDRYTVFRTTGGNGLAWVTVWDSPVDAAEFVNVMTDAMARRYRRMGDTTAIGRELTGRGRHARLTQREVDGRDVVLYVDVPAGASLDVLDLARIQLAP